MMSEKETRLISELDAANARVAGLEAKLKKTKSQRNEPLCEACVPILRRRIADLETINAEVVGKLAVQQVENERLRGIVDKLPKTADEVPMVPGMRVYHCPDDCGHLVLNGTRREFCTGRYCTDIDGEGNIVHALRELVDCYSTREAAEAAKNEKSRDDALGHLAPVQNMIDKTFGGKS